MKVKAVFDHGIEMGFVGGLSSFSGDYFITVIGETHNISIDKFLRHLYVMINGKWKEVDIKNHKAAFNYLSKIFEDEDNVSLTKGKHMANENEIHDFGWAIRQLKEGKKVQRKGWNSKGMFIMLQLGSTVTGSDMRNIPAKEFYGDREVVIHSHIDMKAANDTYVVGWNASQTDMLAEDWQLA